MNFTLRIFLAYFLLVGTGLLLFLYSTHDELRPVVRQTSEETLVDTANLLAAFAPAALVPEAGPRQRFTGAVRDYRQRKLDARIWSHRKTKPNFIVYLTDADGTVVFHTDRAEIGKDYSDWLDVSRTLRGIYGARTTRTDPNDVLSSTMYVAAPVLHQGNRIGVVTVGQPNRSIQPFLEYAHAQILQFGSAILVAALLLGGGLALWLTGSIRRLVHYVERVRDGENAQPPHLREPELARLAASTEQMRREVEGKRYVEQYVQNLTHEMKSPLSAVRGAVEILQERELDEKNRARFLGNIDMESLRIQRLIERLLALATLENRRDLEHSERLNLRALLADEIERKRSIAEQRNLHLELRADDSTPEVIGEGFLLQQALGNLLDNALDFCAPGGTLDVRIERKGARWIVSIDNEGQPVPDYALPRLFERFYSLNRPDTGRKSTGLGLSFVGEIAELHEGTIEIRNTDKGVRARLSLPAA